MNPLRAVARGFDNSLTTIARGLKAATLQFQRGAAYILLPRTRYDYKAQVGDGLSSSIVLMVIGWVKRNFPQAKLRIRLVKVVGGKVTYDPVLPSLTGPGAMLRLMEYPNTFYSGVALLQALIIDYMSTANAIVWKRKNDSGRVFELWWIPKMLIKPKWDAEGRDYISYYEYNPNGNPVKIPVDDIIHLRDGLDPRSPREGLNAMAALAREVFTDEEAANYSATLLANLGVPGVIIAPKDTSSRNQVNDPEQIKASFMEKFTGDKRGEPMVLSAPTDVTVLSFSPEAMRLTDLRRLPEERVSGIYGVPAIVAGLGAGLERSTFANFAEAREAGWEEAIISMGMSIAADLKVQLLNEFVGDITKYEVDFDTSAVRVLQEDQNKLWERALNALNKGGVTRKRFKEMVGEDPDEALDDVYYIPTALEVVNGQEVPPLLAAEEPEETPLEDLLAQPPLVPTATRNGNGNGNGAVATA